VRPWPIHDGLIVMGGVRGCYVPLCSLTTESSTTLTPNWTQSFGYDGLNRLTSAFRSDSGYNHTYNYDSFGNLIVQDNLNSNPTYSINPASNQLNLLVNNSNIYTYDILYQ